MVKRVVLRDNSGDVYPITDVESVRGLFIPTFLEEREYNKLDEIKDNYIYFIYKPWGFGDGFPLILGGADDWKFGDKFPITLSKDKSEFPIKLI